MAIKLALEIQILSAFGRIVGQFAKISPKLAGSVVRLYFISDLSGVDPVFLLDLAELGDALLLSPIATVEQYF